MERECNKDVTYNEIEIKKGTMITVPTFALHYDPDNYADPETFNPDRYLIFTHSIMSKVKYELIKTDGATITKLNVTLTLFFRLEWVLVTASACDLHWRKSK